MRPLRPALSALGLGALAHALLLPTVDHQRPAGFSPRPTAVWIADRDAARLIGLDRSLLVTARIPIDHPVAVVATPEGGAWAVSAAAGRAGAPQRLWRIDADGKTHAVAETGKVLDLTSDGRGGCFWIEEHGSGRRVGHADAQGTVVDNDLPARGASRCVAGPDGGVLIVTPGAVLRLDARTRVTGGQGGFEFAVDAACVPYQRSLPSG